MLSSQTLFHLAQHGNIRRQEPQGVSPGRASLKDTTDDGVRVDSIPTDRSGRSACENSRAFGPLGVVLALLEDLTLRRSLTPQTPVPFNYFSGSHAVYCLQRDMSCLSAAPSLSEDHLSSNSAELVWTESFFLERRSMGTNCGCARLRLRLVTENTAHRQCVER